MMNVLSSVEHVLLIVSLVLTLLFPIYVIFFVIRRIRARRRGTPGAAPSFLTLAVYLLMSAGMLPLMIPGYRGYAAQQRQYQAMLDLRSIAAANNSYYAQTGNYAGLGDDSRIFDVIGYSLPEYENSRYSLYCGHDVIDRRAFTYAFPRPGPDWPFWISPGVSETGFTCMAVGNIDVDPYMDVWTINNTMEVGNISNDLLNEGYTSAGDDPWPKFDIPFSQDVSAVFTYREEIHYLVVSFLTLLLFVLLIRDAIRYRAKK